MKPRAISLALAVALFAVALWLAFRAGKNPLPPSPVATSAPTPAALVSPASAVGRVASTPAAAVPTPLPPRATPFVAAATPTPEAEATVAAATGGTGGNAPTTRDPQIEIGKVRVMFRDYHTIAGENPVGTNAEIMSAIIGGNKRQARLGPPEGMSLNGNGELVDQWNTPYFFHQLSRDLMEVRSAGPDKVMYTSDDVVIR